MNRPVGLIRGEPRGDSGRSSTMEPWSCIHWFPSNSRPNEPPASPTRDRSRKGLPASARPSATTAGMNASRSARSHSSPIAGAERDPTRFAGTSIQGCSRSASRAGCGDARRLPWPT